MDFAAANEYNRAEFAAGRATMDELSELVRQFQLDHGLEPDGKLGPLTRAKIEPILKAHAAEPVHRFPDAVERWRKPLKAALDAVGLGLIPWMEDFALSWIERESGGDPMATGLKRADGFLIETGLGQLYFESPTDVQFGATSAELHHNDTPDAPGKQLSSLLGMIEAYWRRASGSLGSAKWTDRDKAALTKLVHALPALVTNAGQFQSFASLRSWWLSQPRSNLQPSLRPFYGAPMVRCFDNAERTAAVVS